MTARVLLAGVGFPVWVDVARFLEKHHGWQFVYWTIPPQWISDVKECFPEIVAHDVIEAVRGVAAPELSGEKLLPIGSEILDEMAVDESTCLQMMDRVGTAENFTYQERLSYYYDALRYWRTVLEKFSVDFVVFPQAPHMVYDYALYSLCRHLSVKTLMFQMNSILPRLLFPQRCLEDRLHEVEIRYRELIEQHEKATISPAARSYLEKVQRDYGQGMPAHIQKYYVAADHTDAERSLKNKIKYVVFPWRWPTGIKNMINFVTAPAPLHYGPKKPGKTVANSTMSGFEWRITRTKYRAQERKLKKYYEQLVRPPPLDHPYVYVALHFQPERTTSPLGGRYVNQWLMVALVSASVPEGWKVCVKEAPQTYWPQRTKLPARNREFYDRLLSLPNVSLVDLKHDPFVLVDNAMAVATVTGTVGWEAVLRGKPALLFGHAWYLGCEGVFFVQHADECRRALAKISAGYTPAIDKVELFIQALEETAIYAYVDEKRQALHEHDAEENVERIASCLKSSYAQDGN